MANNVNSANLGFERKIFQPADKLRGNIDAAEYKNYARPELDKRRLGEVFDLFKNLKLKEHGNSNDILGRTYEYTIDQFAELEGNRAGEFYKPSSNVRAW